MTRYYGIMPWDIGKLTLFVWQDYMEHIEKIFKVFHPDPKDKKGSKSSGGLSARDKELIEMAKRRHIKLPTKGM